MSTFSALGIAGTGMSLHRTWLNAVSDNIANANNATTTDSVPFQARYVVAAAADYGRTAGVRVTGIELGSTEGRLTFDPDHPLADADGMVQYPDVDMGSQMVQLMMAQRGYQANAAVVDRARDAYTAALQIGRS